MKRRVLSTYNLEADKVRAQVEVITGEDFVPLYKLGLLELEDATNAMLNEIKDRMIITVPISSREILDPKAAELLKAKFDQKAHELIMNELPELGEDDRTYLVGRLIQDMLGLGKLEILLSDENIEEIVVNCSSEPVWIYHRSYGWLKTNILIPSEAQIHNYASIIARRVGRQITTLEPLLDAHLVTGDRANATLFPISTKGHSMTIRRFARKPWTISTFLKGRTLSSEAAALIWLVMQYEMNMIVSGGTGSGKTSFLTVCMPFIQPNQRIVSIEDTRELQLPRFLHWVPLTTRQPNPEGKGEVSMLDLMINSLRMRPDRIILGETRRQKEAEVLFEAMLTGHSVYSTVHADTASQTIKRLANPPINVPESMLEAVHLNVVMFRDRRKSIRRCFQIAEVLPTSETEGTGVKVNLLYRWRPNTDTIAAHSKSISLFDKLSMHTGFTEMEITEQLVTKKKILDWTLKNNIFELDEIGQIMALYYTDPDGVLEVVEKNQSARKLLGVEAT